MTTNKAIAAGVVGGGAGLVANPLSPTISFGFQALGLPPEAADPLGTFLGSIIYGLAMGWLVYLVPNSQK